MATFSATFTNAITNHSLSPNTIIYADANKKESSVTIGSGLSFSGGTLAATGGGGGGSGTVTSVTLTSSTGTVTGSPVTSSGTINIEFAIPSTNLTGKTTDYTLDLANHIILCDPISTSNLVMTLPTAVGIAGKTFKFIKTDTSTNNIVTVTNTTGQTIGGLVAWTLKQRGAWVDVASDGTNWAVVGFKPVSLWDIRSKGTALDQYYTSPAVNTSLTTAAPSVNTLRAMPMLLTTTATISKFAVRVTAGGASSNLRVGLYEDDGNGYPGRLVADCGSQASTSTGTLTFTANLPVTLQPGGYWMVIVGDGTAPTIRTFASSLMPFSGWDNTLGTNPNCGWLVSYTYGTLPAYFPLGATGFSSNPPVIWYQILN